MAALALAAALISLPVAASEAGPAHTTAAGAKAVSLHQAVAREAARAAAQAQAPRAQGPASKQRADQTSANGAMHFLRSRPGMIAVAVVAIGTGYAVYSANHDRIVSAGRK
ncbi:MAG TPA: hypothetical protein VFZ98_05135 [Vicinamibacterales bacterium]